MDYSPSFLSIIPYLSPSSASLITLQGFPAATTLAGISFRHDTSCCNHCIISDRHARKNCHSASNPDFIPNLYRKCPFITFLTPSDIGWMIGRVDSNIRSYENTISNLNTTSVKNCQVKIRKKVISDRCSISIIQIKWCF